LLEHGGRLLAAAQQYAIPVSDWLDLSTGINPNGWPVPEIPASCWLRLPEAEDGLLAAARQYYQCEQLLAVAGSQAAIQTLPLLRAPSKVGVLSPAYAEHATCWQNAGHQLVSLTPETIAQNLEQLDVLIIINPNNPSGVSFSKAQLLDWHTQLQTKAGWLIIDEAFMDASPEHSLSSLPSRDGLIILRSIGKFFGLAGIRCGFVIAPETLLKALDEKLGVWTISHPSRYIATLALLDENWQQQTLRDLQWQSARLQQLLTRQQLKPDGSTALFQWCKTPHAASFHQQLARSGILTRLFSQPDSLRFGLPKDEAQWQRLEHAFWKNF
jgi:cobalamin biosynthetic protein CobC